MAEPKFADPPARDFAGWELLRLGRCELTLNIGRLPTRKSWALYAEDGSVVWVMAYFRSKHEATRAMAIIGAFIARQVM